MARGFRMGGFGGGGQRKTYLGPLNSLLRTYPSNTSGATSTKRTWSKNSYISDLASNNAFTTNKLTSISFTANTVTFQYSGIAGYGLGFVLNSNIQGEKTYRFDYTRQNLSAPFLMLYASDGTFINYLALNQNGEATIPSGVEYVIFTIAPTQANVNCIFTLNSITEI